MIKTIWNWLVWSSSNADKVSLTIKGFASFIPTVVLFFTFLHLNVSSDSLSGVIDGIAVLVTSLGAVITAVVTVVAFLKKIYLTITNQNQAIIAGKV